MNAEFHKADGKIALLLQPDYDFLFQMLSAAAPTCGGVSIQHLFCLSNTRQFTEDKKLCNLEYLKKILPLFINDLDYQVFYYYDNIDAHFQSFNGFPCLIITEDQAVLCTADYQSGIYVRDPEIIVLLWNLYEKYKSGSSSLFQPVKSLVEQCRVLGNMGWDQNPGYCLQTDPCLIPYITPEMAEKYVITDEENRDSVLSFIRSFIQSRSAMFPSENTHVFHTKKGIEKFLSTGRLSEIGEDFCRPFSPEDRIRLLRSLCETCKTGHHFLLKGSLEILPPDFNLCVNASGGYLLFCNARGRQIYLLFQEPFFINIFIDYLASLNEKYFYSTEEHLAYLESVLTQGSIDPAGE